MSCCAIQTMNLESTPLLYSKTIVTRNLAESAARFSNSRSLELDGLIAQGVFTIARRATVVQDGDSVFGTRVVDAIKNEGTPLDFEKSRLVVQAFSQKGAKDVVTKAPTVSRASTRVTLFLSASKSGISIQAHDISQPIHVLRHQWVGRWWYRSRKNLD